ncbi:hypothetical protein OUZ56_010165 [Daphnia magna]|uniref:Uncharacterized protein n=1 Tax=Daphnia magna TaxID=35525 RepID=A0ABR0AI74_9CRUS|nr:hypothetical protein OUZ56_010165 [Daphnia magna]
MDKGLQDGKDSSVPEAAESPAGHRPKETGTRLDEEYAVLHVGKMAQGNEMRGKYVPTEGAVRHVTWRKSRQGQEFRELERVLKGDGTRWKRGLFDGGGQLINWLFETASTKDLDSVHSRLESFNKKGLEVVHILQKQVTLLNVTMGHMSEHQSEISALVAVTG